MRREVLVCGLAICLLSATAFIALRSAAETNCAKESFSGNATNPSACQNDSSLLGLSLVGVVGGALLTAVGAFLRSRATPPKPPDS